MVQFCTVQDINDLLGKKNVNPEEYYIAAGGSIEPEAVTRLIERRSALLNLEHRMNFSSTAVTNEYYDTAGIPRVEVDHYPIISIQSLEVFNGSVYDSKTEGNDRNSDDFYIQDAEAGLIGFWSTPPAGVRVLRISYTYGYATAPEYVEECCAKMVAIDITLSHAFATTCKDAPKKWHNIITDWLDTVEYLLNEFIRIHPLSIKTIGKWKSENFVQQLELMTNTFED